MTPLMRPSLSHSMASWVVPDKHFFFRITSKILLIFLNSLPFSCLNVVNLFLVLQFLIKSAQLEAIFQYLCISFLPFYQPRTFPFTWRVKFLHLLKSCLTVGQRKLYIRTLAAIISLSRCFDQQMAFTLIINFAISWIFNALLSPPLGILSQSIYIRVFANVLVVLSCCYHPTQ